MHIDDDEAEVDLEDESLQNGINGISNLGNTCYINSTLNCLFKIQPLCDYFLNGLHHAEMNLANKLGFFPTLLRATRVLECCEHDAIGFKVGVRALA